MYMSSVNIIMYDGVTKKRTFTVYISKTTKSPLQLSAPSLDNLFLFVFILILIIKTRF